MTRIIRNLWRTSRSLTITISTMWLLGLIGLPYGLWLESLGWWNVRPFATNLYSATVGALFGVPLAVLLIQQLSTISARAIADARQEAAVEILAEKLKVLSKAIDHDLNARIIRFSEIGIDEDLADGSEDDRYAHWIVLDLQTVSTLAEQLSAELIRYKNDELTFLSSLLDSDVAELQERLHAFKITLPTGHAYSRDRHVYAAIKLQQVTSRMALNAVLVPRGGLL